MIRLAPNPRIFSARKRISGVKVKRDNSHFGIPPVGYSVRGAKSYFALRDKLLLRKIRQCLGLGRVDKLRDLWNGIDFKDQTFRDLGVKTFGFLDLFERVQGEFAIPGKSLTTQSHVVEFLDAFLQSAELIENTEIFFNYQGPNRAKVEIEYISPDRVRELTPNDLVHAQVDDLTHDLLVELESMRESGFTDSMNSPQPDRLLKETFLKPEAIERFGTFMISHFGFGMSGWGAYYNGQQHTFLDLSPEQLAHYILDQKVKSVGYSYECFLFDWPMWKLHEVIITVSEREDPVRIWLMSYSPGTIEELQNKYGNHEEQIARWLPDTKRWFLGYFEQMSPDFIKGPLARAASLGLIQNSALGRWSNWRNQKHGRPRANLIVEGQPVRLYNHSNGTILV